MSQLLAPETFEFFARYLLAGYVVISVISAFGCGLRPKQSEILIEAVVLSLIVQLLVLILDGLHGALASRGWLDWLGSWIVTPSEAIIFATRILFLPLALGIALGLLLRTGTRITLFHRLFLPIIPPRRRAYDYAFGFERSAGFVEVTYEDGAKIAGWFGEKSLAAADDNRSDLYLERAYIIDGDGCWVEPHPSRSVLLSLTGVRSIEFLNEENQDGAGQSGGTDYGK